MGFKYLPPGPYGIWASDENYQPGTNPWNGNPTKVKPTSGELAQGIVPAAQVDSRNLNWALNVGTGATSILAHALMRSWQPYLIKQEGTDVDDYEIGGYFDTLGVTLSVTHLVVPFRTSQGNGSVVPAKPALLALRNLTSTEATLLLSSDGSHWAAANTLTSVAFDSDVGGGADHIFDILADDFNDRDNVFLVSDHDRSISRFIGSLDIGDRDIIADVAPSGHGFSCIGCDNVGTLLAGVAQTGSTAQRIFYSTDVGATWTAATTPSTWNTIVIHNFCGTNSTKADLTGAGDVVLATGAIDAKILRSTDQGATWDEITLPTELASRASWDAYQLAWNPVSQLFMCVNGDFDCAVSDDGENWTMLPGSGGLQHLFNPALADRGRLLTAVGPAFVLGANTHGANAFMQRHGVFYTFDNGQTWHFVDFGGTNADNVQQIMGVTEWGGAAVAFAPGKIFVSSSFWEAPVDLDFTA